MAARPSIRDAPRPGNGRWGPDAAQRPCPQTGNVLGESFQLDGLAEVCARDGQWDFMFVGGPLPITGGVGGPINPLAVR